MNKIWVKQKDIAPSKWRKHLATVGGTIALSALALMFYVFCAGYVALNGAPL